MSLAKSLLEATAAPSGKVDRSEKRAIGAALEKAGFGGKVRFKSVGEALNVADGVLAKYGLEWGQVNSAHLFQGDTGHQSIRLARKTEDPFSPIDLSDTSLGFQWSNLGNAYEVIAYMG
jgi:hypothetical protein